MKRIITLAFLVLFTACAVYRQQAGRPDLVGQAPVGQAPVGQAPAHDRDLAAAVTSLEKTVSELQGQVQQLNLLLNSTKPPASFPSVSEPAKVSAAPILCGRCQAITQKGYQCRRNAAAGTSYCWQHEAIMRRCVVVAPVPSPGGVIYRDSTGRVVYSNAEAAYR